MNIPSRFRKVVPRGIISDGTGRRWQLTLDNNPGEEIPRDHLVFQTQEIGDSGEWVPVVFVSPSESEIQCILRDEERDRLRGKVTSLTTEVKDLEALKEKLSPVIALDDLEVKKTLFKRFGWASLPALNDAITNKEIELAQANREVERMGRSK